MAVVRTVLSALMLTLIAAFAAGAAQTCYADRELLRDAVNVIVGSYKCPGFRDALYGPAYDIFLRESAAIDQSTGACERELAQARETASLALLKNRAEFCTAVADTLARDPRLRHAAMAAGVQ